MYINKNTRCKKDIKYLNKIKYKDLRLPGHTFSINIKQIS